LDAFLLEGSVIILNVVTLTPAWHCLFCLRCLLPLPAYYFNVLFPPLP
jgi:hypothetical protein